MIYYMLQDYYIFHITKVLPKIFVCIPENVRILCKEKIFCLWTFIIQRFLYQLRN